MRHQMDTFYNYLLHHTTGVAATPQQQQQQQQQQHQQQQQPHNGGELNNDMNIANNTAATAILWHHHFDNHNNHNNPTNRSSSSNNNIINNDSSNNYINHHNNEYNENVARAVLVDAGANNNNINNNNNNTDADDIDDVDDDDVDDVVSDGGEENGGGDGEGNDDDDDDDGNGPGIRTKRYAYKPSVTRSRTCIHPNELYTLSKKKCTDDDLMECAVQYLQENAMLQEHCNDLTSIKRKRKCQCLSVFYPTSADDINIDDESNITVRVAKFMVHFCKKHKEEQQRLVIQWILISRLGRENKVHKQCLYHFPCLLRTPDDLPPMEWLLTDVRRICYGALLCVLGKGRKFYVTCRDAATSNVLPSHKLKGRRSNGGGKFDKYIAADIRIFFEEFGIYLQNPTPASMFHGIDSQRKLYRLFCYERGWDIILRDSKLMIEDVVPRDNVPEEQRLQICSLKTFHQYWRNNYPQYQLPQPHKNSAYKNKNYSKSKKAQKKAATTTPTTKATSSRKKK